jgi:four helix bundle protein
MATHKNLMVWKKSIPSNIAEDHARYSDKELLRFLFISLGSVSELETQLIIAYHLNFIQEIDYKKVIELNDEVRKMLVSLIRSKNNEDITDNSK